MGRIFVYALYIHPGWQGIGVGTALLERLREIFPTAQSMRLEVLQPNAKAIGFYAARDFRVMRNIRRTGVPALVMQRAIEPLAPTPTWSAVLSVKLQELRRLWS